MAARSLLTWVTRLGLASLLGSIVLVAPACQGAGDEFGVSTCPSRAAFDEVSPVLEKRCGTLDCHGAIGRPLRLYGQASLRLEGNVVGGAVTTPEERDENFLSVCGLEPELMADMMAGLIHPDQLQLLAKPLAIDPDDSSRSGQAHKGSEVLRRGDPGYICIRKWLEGVASLTEDCALARQQR